LKKHNTTVDIAGSNSYAAPLPNLTLLVPIAMQLHYRTWHCWFQ